MTANRSTYGTTFGLMIFLLLISNITLAQEYGLRNDMSELTVLGTSSLHDWEIDAEEQSGKIVFKDAEAGQIGQLQVTVVAESLKSGKSAMDKNTYKALKTSKYKDISFVLAEVKQTTPKGEGSYAVSVMGDLTIAGVKKRIPLQFSLKVNGDKIRLAGETSFNMTDFKIEPPKALLGTITTGDEVTIKFNTLFQ
ncbi:YceI family protein [Pseudozobellia thermophila]|uniref:YceI-like domain-containing protein n=1 Tax=Pseudozobellia thermophila TaxID=192903 RepID=A0A1M6NSY5_9FLAO|nr:YceI family protein [Pseudozobellia thermophila]SHJ98827.1 YceI-like domain-containing protein [Pseudozobellia thermophila]